MNIALPMQIQEHSACSRAGMGACSSVGAGDRDGAGGSCTPDSQAVPQVVLSLLQLLLGSQYAAQH